MAKANFLLLKRIRLMKIGEEISWLGTLKNLFLYY